MIFVLYPKKSQYKRVQSINITKKKKSTIRAILSLLVVLLFSRECMDRPHVRCTRAFCFFLCTILQTVLKLEMTINKTLNNNIYSYCIHKHQRIPL